MSDASDTPREMQVIGELVEMDLAAAKIAFQRLQEAESTEDYSEASKAYRGHSRTLRMSLALREKMLRDRQQGPAPEVEQRLWRERDGARIERRKADLRTALHRVIWCEREGEQADYLGALLEERMELHGRSPAFGLNDLDDHVRDFCDAFGFPPGAGNDWRNLPDPAWVEAEDEPEDLEPALRRSG
jgi:hypothetical protein